MSPCTACGGKGFRYDEHGGVNIPCRCWVEQSLRAYLSRVGVLKSPGAEIDAWIRSEIKGPENLLITLPDLDPREVNGFVAISLMQLWLNTGKKHSYYYENVYSLVEIFLETRELKSSVSAIREGVAILVRNGTEPSNKFQGLLVRQLVTERTKFGLPTWIILCGRNTYVPDVRMDFFRGSGFREIRWGSSIAQDPPEKAGEAVAGPCELPERPQEKKEKPPSGPVVRPGEILGKRWRSTTRRKRGQGT